MKEELSIWSAPLLEGLRKPAYRLEPTAGFLMTLLYLSCNPLQLCYNENINGAVW